MAFTTLQQPIELQPVYNHLIYRLFDSLFAENQFKYVLKTYVNGVLVNTSKMFPSLDGSIVFDPSRIIANYLSYNIAIPFNAVTTLEDKGSLTEICSYRVDSWIEYINTDDELIELFAAEGLTKHAWNGVADYFEGMDLTSYVNSLLPVDPNAPVPYLNWQYYPTNYSDRTIKLRENRYRHISFFTKKLNNDITTFKLKVNTVTKTGTQKQFVKEFTVLIPDSAINRIYHMGIGIPQLNAITWTSTTIPTGYTSTISSSEDVFYSVSITPATGNAVTKSLLFKILPVCSSRFNEYTAIYQTKNGSFGYIDFAKRNNTVLTTDKEVYKGVLPYNYNSSTRPIKTFKNTSNEVITLSTDWLHDQNQISEVKDLLSSPVVYLQDENNQYYPAVVSSSSYEIYSKKQDKLVRYEVEFVKMYENNIIYK